MKKFKDLFKLKKKEKKAGFELRYAYTEAYAKFYYEKYDFGALINGDENKLFIPSKITGSMVYMYYNKKLKDIQYVTIADEHINRLALKWEEDGRPVITSTEV